jgi:uncharacterized protein YceH (UPF0502 family)
MNEAAPTGDAAIQPKWRPLGRIERRVLGTLVEKAKTTPEAYPLTLNALTNGCNQKSNRDPQMSLSPDQVETSLEKLRAFGAVMEVSGSGRVAKYRHLMYEWMGVDKLEAAVMTELMLRGSQTVGELRGRAARMDPIPDLSSLQPLLESLIAKKLLISLTPAGRGQIVTHGLYLPEEMDKVRAAAGHAAAQAELNMPASASAASAAAPAAAAASFVSNGSGSSAASSGPSAASSQSTAASSSVVAEVAELRDEVRKLQAEVERLKADLQDLWSNLT